jgi:hypothetical protein
MKIIALEAELYRADRRTDMTNLLVAFRNFVNRPQNQLQIQTIKTAMNVVPIKIEDKEQSTKRREDRFTMRSLNVSWMLGASQSP